MARKARSTMSTATVSKTIEKVGGEVLSKEETDEVIGVHKFETPPARVGIALGLTINLGKYSSARIDVSLDMPCYKEEIDDTYLFVQKWCEDRIEAEKKMIEDYRGPEPISKSNPL